MRLTKGAVFSLAAACRGTRARNFGRAVELKRLIVRLMNSAVFRLATTSRGTRARNLGRAA